MKDLSCTEYFNLRNTLLHRLYHAVATMQCMRDATAQQIEEGMEIAWNEWFDRTYRMVY